MDERMAEFVGALIGDGYLESTPGHYRFGLVGHPENDMEYYVYLRQIAYDLWQKSPSIGVRARGLRMTISSKEAYTLLTSELGLPIGHRKSSEVLIPSQILSDWGLLRRCIRGIFDTDGSVFSSKKPRVANYPSLEITTSSVGLANQIRDALLAHGYRVAKIRSYKSRHSVLRSYKICLYGRRNLAKWMEEIGSSNPVKRDKAMELLGGGSGNQFYKLPMMTLTHDTSSQADTVS